MVSLQTSRVLLRPWRESDREPFAAMNADPMTMRFFPALWSREQSDAAFERVQKHWRDRGFGIWVAEIQGQFAGTMGLQQVPFEAFFTPAVELGYRFLPQWWNQGYATEGARAAVDYGLEQLELPEIVAFAVKQNRGSTRVMEKIGMQYDRDFESPFFPPGHAYASHALYRVSSTAG